MYGAHTIDKTRLFSCSQSRPRCNHCQMCRRRTDEGAQIPVGLLADLRAASRTAFLNQDADAARTNSNIS